MSYHTWRTVEFIDESPSSSRNSNANTFGLSINSRGNGFLIIEKIDTKKKIFFKKFYRHRAQLWLTLATPLTQRKQKECPHGNLTGLINGCKHTLHSSERDELLFIINSLILSWHMNWLIVLEKKNKRSVDFYWSISEQ
jgi:hypothetical protein